MNDKKLTRYVGDYYHFREVFEVQQAQRQAAYERQQQEIAQLEDFVARNKARVATRNMAMSRQKKLDKMERLDKIVEKPKPEFNFNTTSRSPLPSTCRWSAAAASSSPAQTASARLRSSRASWASSPPFRARSKPARILRSAISSRKWIKI